MGEGSRRQWRKRTASGHSSNDVADQWTVADGMTAATPPAGTAVDAGEGAQHRSSVTSTSPYVTAGIGSVPPPLAVPCEASPHVGPSPSAALGSQPDWRPDHTVKFLLCGESGVGKTALLLRFVNNRFSDEMAATVGVDFAIKRITLHDTNLKLTIWDTAGQERFRTLTATFYRGCKAVILVYDVTRRETLEALQEVWLGELAAHVPNAGSDVVRMVVGNKVDMPREARQVTWEEGSEFARRHGCLFVETSAKEGVAVGLAFEAAALKVLESPALLLRRDSGEVTLAIGNANMGVGSRHGGYCSGYC